MKRILFYSLLILVGCAPNKAVIKPQPVKNASPFKSDVFLNGRMTYLQPAISLQSLQTGQFTDERDGQTYKWVKIGAQVWMTQNLNYKTDKHSWTYNNDESNAKRLGRLYSFDVLLQACPKGWHVPTDTEWMLLEKDLGLTPDEAGQVGNRGDIAARFLPGNPAGFDVLYGGWYTGQKFIGMNASASFWTSTGYDQPIAYRTFKKNRDGIYRNTIAREYGLSLRCVKDYW